MHGIAMLCLSSNLCVYARCVSSSGFLARRTRATVAMKNPKLCEKQTEFCVQFGGTQLEHWIRCARSASNETTAKREREKRTAAAFVQLYSIQKRIADVANRNCIQTQSWLYIIFGSCYCCCYSMFLLRELAMCAFWKRIRIGNCFFIRCWSPMESLRISFVSVALFTCALVRTLACVCVYAAPIHVYVMLV